MSNYYNTNKLKGEELSDANKKAKSQEDLILEFFQQHPNGIYTPFQVCEAVFDNNCPVTSCRRAMTNLTKADKLVKTDFMKMGRYKSWNHTWKLKK